MNKLLKNVLFDFAVYSIIAYSFIYGDEWMKSAATNIVYFLSFVSFFTAMCCLLMNKSSLVSVSEKYKQRTNWHKAYSNLSCVIEVLLLAAFGWWWCRAAFVLNIAGRSRLEDITKDAI